MLAVEGGNNNFEIYFRNSTFQSSVAGLETYDRDTLMEGGGGMAHIYGNNISIIVETSNFLSIAAGSYGKGGIFHLNSYSGNVNFRITNSSLFDGQSL